MEEKGCFGGCLGCLGCGCLLVILLVVIPTVWFGYWVNTDGRVYLADGVQKVTNEAVKYAFEPQSASQIATLTKEIRDDMATGKIGIIDSFNYVMENIKNEKLQGQIIFAVIYRHLTGKIKDSKTPGLIDAEGAEAVRTIMYALSQNKIDGKNAVSKVSSLLEKKKSSQNGEFNVEDSFKTSKVKNNITKEDMEKVVKALKQYVKDQNLETPARDITPDSLAKDEVIKFLSGLKKLSKK